MGLRQSHDAVEAPTGSEQSFHSAELGLELGKNLGPAPFDSGSPGSVRGMSPYKKIGPSFPGEMRLDLEESGVGSQQDQPVSKLFSPSGIIPALRSQRLKKSDTLQVGDCSPMSSTTFASAERDVSGKIPNGDFAGPGLCSSDFSSAASRVSSSGDVRGARSKKSTKLFEIEVSPSAGQGEETSTSERPYQRDEAFVDQSDGYTIEAVYEYGSLKVKEEEKVAEVKSDPRGIAGGDGDRSDLEEHWKGGSIESSDSKRSYDCQYCSKKFSTRQALGGHQGIHKRHSKGSYDCQYCSKKFSTGQALGGHQKIHKKERQQAESARSQASRSAVSQSMGTTQACSATRCNRCKTCSCLLGEDIEARDGYLSVENHNLYCFQIDHR